VILSWVCCWVFSCGDDCGVELGCIVLMMPPVGHERGCAAGCMTDWPEVRGEIEEAATGAVAGLSAAGRMFG